LCRDFYIRKQELSSSLIQQLDALSNERPEMLRAKRKHLVLGDDSVEPMKEIFQWMRINAERERIQRFKAIAVEGAQLYYTVLQRFAET
jgi:hypothetical protein